MLINTYVANIKLQTLAKPATVAKEYTYSDLHLDLLFEYTKNNELLRKREIKDISIDYDLAAIKNSITNLFLTIPGQKILNPLFGINLIRYIFEPCDEYTAQLIGQNIQEGIITFEPRVLLSKIKVIAQPNEQSYMISLTLTVPKLNSTSFQLAGTLSNSGFYLNN